MQSRIRSNVQHNHHFYSYGIAKSSYHRKRELLSIDAKAKLPDDAKKIAEPIVKKVEDVIKDPPLKDPLPNTKEPPPKEDQPSKEPPPKEDQPSKEPPPKEDQPSKEPPPKEDQPSKEPPPKEDQPSKEPPPKEDQPAKEPPPKEDQPAKEPPPKEDQPAKEPPPKEDQPAKEPPPKEDQPAKEPPPKEDQPAKEPSPKEDQPPKEPPPKEDQPLKEPPPEEDQPKEPPPKEDQPKEPPPNEDQPKEPPPNEDQPKEPPPKEEPPKDPESNPPTNTPKANNPKDNNANPKQDEAVVINSSNLIKTPDISPPQNPKELSLTPPTFNSLPDELSSQSKPDKNAINKNDNSNIDKSISDSDQATSTAYNPTKVNDPLSNPSSTTQSILPPTTLGVPISPFDPRSPYRIPAIIGLVIAILLALFSLAFLLRKTVFSKKYSTPYQRTYSVDGSIHNKLIQRQYSMTDHGLPPWSPTSFDNDAEEIRLPSPTVIRKSCSPPDSHLVDINLNENMSSTAYKNIESSSSTNAKRSSFYKDLARKSSLLRYVKDFDDDIIEEESNMSSNYDYPNLPDQAVTWEECMK